MWCSYHDSFTGNSRDIDSRAVTPDKRLCIHRQDVYIPGKKEHSKQKFRFFPFKYFGTSDLYCLGEYLRAHRKLTCDIYRLNSACSIYWTWKSCRNKVQHGKWTEEDGRHQFHFRRIIICVSSLNVLWSGCILFNSLFMLLTYVFSSTANSARMHFII